MASPSEQVLALTWARQPTLGTGRLICIDGLAGSGKTTLARALSTAEPSAAVVATDEMLQGWRGLPGLADSVAALLSDLALGRPGTWRQWDWYDDRWAQQRSLAPTPLLVLEGVGSFSPAIAHLVTTLVWVEADAQTRLQRAHARDGGAFAEHWPQWQADEAALHRRQGTRARADLVLEL